MAVFVTKWLAQSSATQWLVVWVLAELDASPLLQRAERAAGVADLGFLPIGFCEIAPGSMSDAFLTELGANGFAWRTGHITLGVEHPHERGHRPRPPSRSQ